MIGLYSDPPVLQITSFPEVGEDAKVRLSRKKICKKRPRSVKNLAFLSDIVYIRGCVMRRNARTFSVVPCATTRIRRRGTSILELLVVVLVIGIVLGMLLPSLKRSLDLAHSAVCMHNLREIGRSLAVYRVENDGWLPGSEPQEEELEVDRGASSPDRPVWFAPLYPNYLADRVALTCPRDPFKFRMLQASGQLDDPTVVDYASYGINSVIAHGGGGKLADLDRHMPSRPLDTILVADLGPDRIGGYPTIQPTTRSSGDQRGAGNQKDAGKQKGTNVFAGPSRNRSLLSWDDGYDPFSLQKPNTWLTARHGDGINILTLAGGVRAARTKELMRRPVRRYYRDCASGSCSLCNAPLADQVYHYSFAQDRLYWWTGAVRID